MSTYKNQSLYEKIQLDLIEKIQNGSYKAGDRLPSEKDLSEFYHVSRITSAKALTELSLGGYIHRIQGKGSFVNPLGSHITPSTMQLNRAPNTNTIKKIGLIIPEYKDYHSGNIIKGVSDVLKFPAFFLNIVINHNGFIEDYTLDYFLKSGYEGFILFPTDCEYYSDIILKMHLNKFPFLLIDRMFPGIQCNSVTTDNEHGSKIAIDYLVATGHRKIAFVSDSSYQEQITALRFQSYLQSISHYGLNAYSYEGFFAGKDSTSIQEEFLSHLYTKNITAVLASNSYVATRLYTFCLEHNLKIPDDLSIICFDKPNVQAKPYQDFFTYIEQNSYEMGKQAGLILQNIIQHEPTVQCTQLVLEPKLILNLSTCSPT